MTHEETIKRIQELVPESIGEDLYRCNRVWEAWQMNTMSEDDFEIISQPITLAVVLLATKEVVAEKMWAVLSDGEFCGQDANDGSPIYHNVFWDLSKNNFNDQSEETKTFIGGMLGN